MPAYQNLLGSAQDWYGGQQPTGNEQQVRQQLYDRAQDNFGGSRGEQNLEQFANRNLNRWWGANDTGQNQYAGALADLQPVNPGGSNRMETANPYLSQLSGSQGSNPFTNRLAQGGASNRYVNQLAGQGAGNNQYAGRLMQHGSNPYLRQAADEATRGIRQDFSESVLPGLNATFGNAGQTGGSAHALATGRAAGQLADTVGGVRSDIYGRAYESDQDRRLQSNLALLGSGEAGLDRAQRGLTSAAGLEESRLGRGLQGLTSAAGFAGEDLNRDQRGLLAAGQLAGQDLARNQQGQQFHDQLNYQGRQADANRQLQGLTTAGILGGQDLSRQAGSEQFQRGLNSQRQFQSAGLIPVSSALEQQRTRGPGWVWRSSLSATAKVRFDPERSSAAARQQQR